MDRALVVLGEGAADGGRRGDALESLEARPVVCAPPELGVGIEGVEPFVTVGVLACDLESEAAPAQPCVGW